MKTELYDVGGIWFIVILIIIILKFAINMAWVAAATLAALGLLYYLSKDDNNPKCPYCKSFIKKYASQCPKCKTNLGWE